MTFEYFEANPKLDRNIFTLENLTCRKEGNAPSSLVIAVVLSLSPLFSARNPVISMNLCQTVPNGKG